MIKISAKNIWDDKYIQKLFKNQNRTIHNMLNTWIVQGYEIDEKKLFIELPWI